MIGWLTGVEVILRKVPASAQKRITFPIIWYILTTGPMKYIRIIYFLINIESTGVGKIT